MCVSLCEPSYMRPDFSIQRCVKLIVDKFPGSPRVDCLEGIRMEATADPELVLIFYDQLLDADSSNAVRRVIPLFPPYSLLYSPTLLSP